MLRVRYLLGTLAIALLGWALGPAAAGAAANTVTVGAALPAPQEPVGGCNTPSGCGLLILEATAPSSGTASPFGGVVTSWKVGGASSIPGYGIAVVRPNEDGTFTVTATETPVTPAGGELETFSADLPIAAGEFVVLNVPYEGEISLIEGASLGAGFPGALATGETRSPSETGELPLTFSFAATIEERTQSAPVTPTTTPSSSPSSTAPAAGPPAEGPHCVVPKLAGKKLAAAKAALRRAHCGVGFVVRPRPAKAKAKGHRAKVRAESPKPGKSLPAGTEVSLRLG